MPSIAAVEETRSVEVFSLDVVHDTYIGRGSPWGNPFVIGKDGDRDEVIDKYERHLRESPRLLDRLHELRGKTLACFCAPARCHGDILARYADAPSHTPKEEPMRVATDGGCHPNPGGPGGWAWVAEDGRYGCGSFASGTNNVAELMAIKEALLAHPDEPITIVYDSQYAANCVKDWGPNWRKRGVRDKANLDLVFSILDVVDRRSHPIEWVWVRGHVGHPMNEAADSLATRMRLVGRESREDGDFGKAFPAEHHAEVPAAKAKRSSRAPRPASGGWGNMTAIGAERDMSARDVGIALRKHGLLDDGEPTKKAIDMKAARWVERRSGTAFPQWNIEVVLGVIAP
jgi:ribonuclease HI